MRQNGMSKINSAAEQGGIVMSSSFKVIGVIALVVAGAAATMFSGAFAAVDEGGDTGVSEDTRAAIETTSTSQPISDASLGVESASHTLPLVDVGEPLDVLEGFREFEDLIELPCAGGFGSSVSIFSVPDPCDRLADASGGGGLSSGSDLSDPDSLTDIICGSRGNLPGYGVPGIVADGADTRSHESRSWSDDHTTHYRYVERDSEGRERVVLGWELNDDGSGRSGGIEFNEDGDVISVFYTEWNSEGDTTFEYEYDNPDGGDPDEALEPISERDGTDEDGDSDAGSRRPAVGGTSQPDPVNPDDQAIIDEWCRQQAEAMAERECRTDPDCESPVDTNCDDPFVNPDPSETGSGLEGDSTTVINCGGASDVEGGCEAEDVDIVSCVDTTPDSPCPTQDPGPDGPDGPGGSDPSCPGNLGPGSGGGPEIELDTPALIDEMCAMIDCGQSWAELYFSSTLQSEKLNAPAESLK